MTGLVLILGGTGEARDLAARLVESPVRVRSSLAGRVARPRLPVGELRVGGFGGPGGLAAYLIDETVTAVVDATHPFARRISANAAIACAAVGVPLVRLARPGWSEQDCGPGGTPWTGRPWHWVGDAAQAAGAAAGLGQRPVLTVGRQDLHSYVEDLGALDALARVVDPPEFTVPARWRILLDRGPYTVSGETALLCEHEADVLVTKDSGGPMTRPKLEAAALLDLAVVIVRRPPPPAGVVLLSSVEEAVAWVYDRC